MDERRRYFRINDTIGLNYRLVDREQKNQELPQHASCVAGLKSALAVQEQRFQQLINMLQKKDMHMAEALSVLNKKIHLISNHLVVEQNREHEMDYPLYHVNLSACGVAFIAQEELQVDTCLEVNLLLSGDLTPLQLVGTVVGCQSNGRQFYVRVDFDDMDGQDQETLIHYMLKRQGEQMRDMLSRRPDHSRQTFIN